MAYFRYDLCAFPDGQTDERGTTEAGGSSGVADRENVTADGDITTKDSSGGITRRTGHTEEKTGSQHQRPHQATPAGLVLSQAAQIFRDLQNWAFLD